MLFWSQRLCDVGQCRPPTTICEPRPFSVEAATHGGRTFQCHYVPSAKYCRIRITSSYDDPQYSDHQHTEDVHDRSSVGKASASCQEYWTLSRFYDSAFSSQGTDYLTEVRTRNQMWVQISNRIGNLWSQPNEQELVTNLPKAKQSKCMITTKNNTDWEIWRLNGKAKSKASQLLAIVYTVSWDQ